MKTFNEYIFEDYIIERLYFHTCVEFKLDHPLYPYIVESLGKFDNAGQCIMTIINDLSENLTSHKIDCRNDNVFFDFIYIEISNNGYGSASYNRYENKTIYMTLYCKDEEDFETDVDEYAKIILHELLHGYEDFNRMNNEGKSIFDYHNDKYRNSFKAINSFDDVTMYIGRCNYFLNDQERNAYLSSLETEIEKIFRNKHITIEDFNYTKFKEMLKNSGIFKIYFDLKKIIIMLSQDNIDDKTKEHVENVWKKLYREDMTYNMIIKEISSKWKKFKNKFEQLVPKLICRYIDDSKIKEMYVNESMLNKKEYNII